MEVSQQEKGERCLPFASAYTVVPPTPNEEEQTDPTPTPWSSPCGCSPSSSAPTHSSNGRHTCPPQLAGAGDSGSAFHLLLASGPTSRISSGTAVLLPKLPQALRVTCSLWPPAPSLAGLPGRWENTGPCLCCGVAMGCWASTPPFLVPSLRPGSDLTWELTPEHMLSTVCLSHRGEGTTGAQSAGTLPWQGQLKEQMWRGALIRKLSTLQGSS